MTSRPKRLVIAVDCDDVLVRTTPFFIDAYNAAYGTSVNLTHAHDLHHSVWGGDAAEDVLEKLNKLIETESYKNLGPSLHEIESLRRLSKRHSLHLVTARKPEEREGTQAMLDRDLPGVFVSLDFVGWGGSKGEVCKRIGADILIDDSARHLHDAVEKGLPAGGAILFGEYPWNHDDKAHEDLRHCADWYEVERVVGEIADAK